MDDYIGKRYTICNRKLVNDAYEDQYGIFHEAYVYTDLRTISVIEDIYDWAVPNYKGEGSPYKPYGKIHRLRAMHGSNIMGEIFRTTQNWDSGRLNHWVREHDGEFFFPYTKIENKRPVLFSGSQIG
jgi:hypothetical protein